MNQKRNFSFKELKQTVLLGSFRFINSLENQGGKMVQVNRRFTFRVISLSKRQVIHQINVQRRKIIGIFFNFSCDNLLDSQPFFFILFDKRNLSHLMLK